MDPPSLNASDHIPTSATPVSETKRPPKWPCLRGVRSTPLISAKLIVTSLARTAGLAELRFNGRNITYRPVSGGISNTHWRIDVEGESGSFFLKMPGRGTEMFIDRKAAQAASRQAEAIGLGPRTYDYLESVTGSTRGSLHVLVKRMRDRGLLTAIDGGTHDVQHVATKRGR